MSRAGCAQLTLLFLSVAAGHFPSVLAQSKENIARKFDEFGDIQQSDLKARLDYFSVQLQTEQGTKGFILGVSQPTGSSWSEEIFDRHLRHSGFSDPND